MNDFDVVTGPAPGGMAMKLQPPAPADKAPDKQRAASPPTLPSSATEKVEAK